MLQFDRPINAATRATGLRVQAGGVNVPGTYTLEDGQRRIRFTPATQLAASHRLHGHPDERPARHRRERLDQPWQLRVHDRRRHRHDGSRDQRQLAVLQRRGCRPRAADSGGVCRADQSHYDHQRELLSLQPYPERLHPQHDYRRGGPAQRPAHAGCAARALDPVLLLRPVGRGSCRQRQQPRSGVLPHGLRSRYGRARPSCRSRPSTARRTFLSTRASG